MDINKDIHLLVPQRPPMLMIDRLLYSDEKITRTVLQVSKGNIFVKNEKLTEPGLVENIAQTAAAGIGYICRRENRAVPMGYIGAVQNLEISGLPTIAEEIETEVVLENKIMDLNIVSGTVRCKGMILATCIMKIFISK